MNRITVFASLVAFLFGAAPRGACAAQAAVEAGAISASVSGLASASSRSLTRHTVIVSRLPERSTTTVVHRTQPTHTKARSSDKTSGQDAVATAVAHGAKQQGHIVGVWPPNALTKTQPDSQ